MPKLHPCSNVFQNIAWQPSILGKRYGQQAVVHTVVQIEQAPVLRECIALTTPPVLRSLRVPQSKRQYRSLTLQHNALPNEMITTTCLNLRWGSWMRWIADRTVLSM